jgi:hypothetical protein
MGSSTWCVPFCGIIKAAPSFCGTTCMLACVSICWHSSCDASCSPSRTRGLVMCSRCGAVCACVFPDAAVSMELELLWPVFHPSPSRTESYHPLYPAGRCEACAARHALLLLPSGRNWRYLGVLPATEGLSQCLLSSRVGVLLMWWCFCHASWDF